YVSNHWLDITGLMIYSAAPVSKPTLRHRRIYPFIHWLSKAGDQLRRIPPRSRLRARMIPRRYGCNMRNGNLIILSQNPQLMCTACRKADWQALLRVLPGQAVAQVGPCDSEGRSKAATYRAGSHP